MYLITEPHDGIHVRIIAAARTIESALRQYDRERRARAAHGYSFFRPVRQVIGDRRAVDEMRDAEVAALPTWEDHDGQ